jgi:hypothetical protein
MAHADTEDFATIPDPNQLDMFGAPPAQTYDPDPESVRAELHDILARARAAPKQPWDAREASYYRTVFPQMANWLPEDEAKQLRFAFEKELKRLKAA